MLSLVTLFIILSLVDSACLDVEGRAGNSGKQIIFGHVYKTGGSTMRDVFRLYSDACNYSVATLVLCNKDSVKSSESVLPCTIKDWHAGVNKFIIPPSRGIMGKYPTIGFAQQFDVITGHVPHRLYPAITNPSKPQLYVTWLRHPLSMIISSALYLIGQKNMKEKSGTTSADVIEKILSKLVQSSNIIPTGGFDTKGTANGMYSQFLKYLYPGGLAASVNLPEKEVISRMRSIFESFQVIGVLERHEISLKMLQRGIDPAVSLGEKFWDRVKNLKKNTVIPLLKGVNQEIRGQREPKAPRNAQNPGGGEGVNKGKGRIKKGRPIELDSKGGYSGLSPNDVGGVPLRRKLQEEEEAPSTIKVNIPFMKAPSTPPPIVDPTVTLTTDNIRNLIISNATLFARINKALQLEYQLYAVAYNMHMKQCLAYSEDSSLFDCKPVPVESLIPDTI